MELFQFHYQVTGMIKEESQDITLDRHLHIKTSFFGQSTLFGKEVFIGWRKRKEYLNYWKILVFIQKLYQSYERDNLRIPSPDKLLQANELLQTPLNILQEGQ